MSRQAFAGIDVAFAKKKSLPLCVAVWNGDRLEPLPIRRAGLPSVPRGKGNRAALEPEVVRGFARETASVLAGLASALDLEIERVAIDAPSAPCLASLNRRRAELAMDDRGYSCIPTPSAEYFDEIREKCRAHLAQGGEEVRLPHANQLWMLVGFALFEELGCSYEVLEVYPHATVRSLGLEAGHKSTKAGYAEQLAAIAGATGWHDPADLDAALKEHVYGSPHDRLDAFMSAWVAALPETKLLACGAPPDDVIWVPRPSRVGSSSKNLMGPG